MVNNLSILGSTGSIGTQTLDVARKLDLNVTSLCAYGNIDLLEAQIREFSPKTAVVYDEAKASELKLRIADTDTKVLASMDGLLSAAADSAADLIVNAVVGMIGLRPTLEAIKAKKNIAFANKETLVAGGELVMKAAAESGVTLFPVDSEHSAVFQCMQAMPPNRALKKIILTASGGPFFDKSYEYLKSVTVEDALRHPNWSMGAKITVDSATMMNKGLEIIEAARLFDMPQESIDVVIHRESIIHSMIEFDDNSVLAQLGLPDMRIPIQYAVTYPERYPSPVYEIDFAKLAKMTFYAPDETNFKCLAACKKALSRGGVIPAVANGANEVANKLFRESRISFLDIGEVVSAAVDSFPCHSLDSLDDVLNADAEAREFVYEYFNIDKP